MTIREKITTLGLSPQQTIEITLLLMESHTIGFAQGCKTVKPDVKPDGLAFVSAELAFKVLDNTHEPAPAAPNIGVASAVFGYDFSNDLP